MLFLLYINTINNYEAIPHMKIGIGARQKLLKQAIVSDYDIIYSGNHYYIVRKTELCIFHVRLFFVFTTFLMKMLLSNPEKLYIMTLRFSIHVIY
jgi:hypothetical protein